MDLSARTVFLVAYDVCDPKRLVKTRRVVLGFGESVQFSVFRCVLTKQETVELRAALADVIDVRKDQVIFADLGPVKGRGARCITSLGKSCDEYEQKALVI